MIHGCPVCGLDRTRRSNYRRGVTCGGDRCITARKAHGGRQGRHRAKPGLRRTNALKRYHRTGALTAPLHFARPTAECQTGGQSVTI